jgi:hypothetical protein
MVGYWQSNHTGDCLTNRFGNRGPEIGDRGNRGRTTFNCERFANCEIGELRNRGRTTFNCECFERVREFTEPK